MPPMPKAKYPQAGPEKGPVVLEFFVKDIEKDVWVCQVIVSDEKDSADAGEPKRCSVEFSATSDVNKGTRAFNLKRHVQRFHPNKWKAFEEKLSKEAQKKAEKSGQSGAGPSRQTNLSKFFISDKITLTMTKAILVDSIVRDQLYTHFFLISSLFIIIFFIIIFYTHFL